MDYKSYKRRLERKGNSLPSSLSNKAKDMVNRNFDTSPSFLQIKVNDVLTDSIVNKSTKYDEKLINFRPGSAINTGSEITIGEQIYLLTEVFEDVVYISGKAKQCNSFFPAITDKTRVLKGHDDYGKPVYVEEPVIKQLPCIVERVGYSLDTNQQLVTSNDSLKISLKYFVSESIKKNAEFYMYDEKYKITSIDKTKVINNVGILTITGERV